MTNQDIELAYEYKRIASMDLIDFSQQLQDCIKHGYELVLDNENSPVQLGTLLTCGVRKAVDVNKWVETKMVTVAVEEASSFMEQATKLASTKHRRSAKTTDKILA